MGEFKPRNDVDIVPYNKKWVRQVNLFMDIMSILGIVTAFGVIVYGIITSDMNWSNLNDFIDIPSIAITVGGTFAALMLTFPLRVFISLPKMLFRVFVPQRFNPKKYILQVCDIADDVRRAGLLSIERQIDFYKDKFMRKGLELAVDAIPPEQIRDILESEVGFMIDRHKLGISFCEKGAALAPGFGMIGTLIGLINMLAGMESGAANLMANMAIALVTTFYGVILANVLFLPIGNKLQKRSDEEILCKQIIIEGIVSIVNLESSKQIREKLIAFIPPSMRRSFSPESDRNRDRED